MKNNWKLIMITCIITLLPIVLGIAVYDQLPARIAIHWGINNEPNGWASKNFAVFGLPILMMILQLICMGITELKRNPDEPLPKMIRFTVWMIPVLCIILYCVTLAMALGMNLDIRKIVCFILGIIFIGMGNYFPKISYQNRNMVNMPVGMKNEADFKKYLRIMGIVLIIEGIVVLVSIFFAPVVSIIALCLLIVFASAMTIYGFKIGRKK